MKGRLILSVLALLGFGALGFGSLSGDDLEEIIEELD
jgi:hypothetical protein